MHIITLNALESILKNAQLKIKGDRIDTDNELIRSIRFSQFEPGVVRVVIDLEEKIAGKISFFDGKRQLVYRFQQKQGR